MDFISSVMRILNRIYILVVLFSVPLLIVVCFNSGTLSPFVFSLFLGLAGWVIIWKLFSFDRQEYLTARRLFIFVFLFNITFVCLLYAYYLHVYGSPYEYGGTDDRNFENMAYVLLESDYRTIEGMKHFIALETTGSWSPSNYYIFIVAGVHKFITFLSLDPHTINPRILNSLCLAFIALLVWRLAILVGCSRVAGQFAGYFCGLFPYMVFESASWKHGKQWIVRLKERNQDVQLHCFRHMTYASQEVNDINIQRGLKVLRRMGVTPNAIVSPFGYNYRGFSEAIKEHGFVYSSEFGYAVDDLPSRPWNDKNYPFQIPVHPACSGVLGQAGFSRQEQFDHMFDVVQRKCDADGICILYDHPKGGLEAHEALYIDLFDRLSNGPYEYICMSDYYHAWIERSRNPTILYDQGRIQVNGFRDSGFRLEQVTNGSIRTIRWENATLPQVSLPARAEEFYYPPEWIQELACKKGLLHLKQRNLSRFAWHVNEAYNTLGRKSGYFRCRRLLARVKWLRALRLWYRRVA